jgi:DNA-binding IclR family transcriptional regulator
MVFMDKQTRHLAVQLLGLLYNAASRGQRPTLVRLSTSLGIDEPTTRHLLHSLDQAGLVDRTRLRLTLAGLTVAVATAQAVHQGQGKTELAA